MSIFNKNWNLYDPAPREFFRLDIGQPSGEVHAKYPEIIKQILWNRGVKEADNIASFLSPDYSADTHDPFLLKDMERAVERVSLAIKNKEKIFIYGDYDADGVCASTLLKDGLEKMGASEVGVYIPHREEEGYGMNMTAVDEIMEGGADLIITVDCGSTNTKEARYAEKSGVDVIVTDHHQVLEKERFSYALVNPHQSGDKYPFKNISGTTVAFKLIQALAIHEKQDEFSEKDIKWLLDLVGISTITDVMPLLDENRALVKYGLIVLSQSKRPGLRALMEVSGIDPEFNKKDGTTNLNAFHVGFMLGPRINAAGRMEHAQLAFDLLNAPDMPTARKLAWELEDRNKDRQKLVEDIISEIDTSMFEKEPAIYEGRENWPIGVLGIVAGRLAENYNKPSFIYQIQEGKLVGSARTPSYVNTVDILKESSDFLLKFGGHAQAGGFTADTESEKALGKNIKNCVKDKTQDLLEKDLKPRIDIDAKLEDKDISWDLYDSMLKCAPFGEKNPKPVFLLKGVSIKNINMVGANGNHFKCDILTDTGQRFGAIGFRFGDAVNSINNGDKADIVFELDKNEWNGNKELQFKLIDIKKYESR